MAGAFRRFRFFNGTESPTDDVRLTAFRDADGLLPVREIPPASVAPGEEKIEEVDAPAVVQSASVPFQFLYPAFPVPVMVPVETRLSCGPSHTILGVAVSVARDPMGGYFASITAEAESLVDAKTVPIVGPAVAIPRPVAQVIVPPAPDGD